MSNAKKRIVVVCDLDNTLIDSANLLKEFEPGYDPSSQKSYDLDGEILKHYQNEMFYHHPKLNYNWEVVEALQKFVLVECQREELLELIISFRSLSFSRAVSEAKVSYLYQLIKALEHISEKVSVSTDWISEAELDELDLYRFVMSQQQANESVAFVMIDDAPKRLEEYYSIEAATREKFKVDVSIWKVVHPYNLGISPWPNARVLYPNYYAIEDVLDNFLENQ